jgi:hypothetical protein
MKQIYRDNLLGAVCFNLYENIHDTYDNTDIDTDLISYTFDIMLLYTGCV